MKLVQSVAGVPVRLTPERWSHIARRHLEMANLQDRVLETVSSPDYVQEGDRGTMIALKHYTRTPLTSKYCVVVYRETGRGDGFVVTAYLAAKPRVGGP